MPTIQKFLELCDKAKEVHKKKNDDYAEESSKFFNFEVQAQFIKWFAKCSDVDKAFASICGLKIARIANLLSKSESPNNESITDSFEDLFIYVGLWYAWQFEGKENTNLETGRIYSFDPTRKLFLYNNEPQICIVCNEVIYQEDQPYGQTNNWLHKRCNWVGEVKNEKL